MNYILSSQVKKIIRKCFTFQNVNHLPIQVVPGNGKPKIVGEDGGYFTRGGTKIDHPIAYSKKGWSNMIYIQSTKEIEVPEAWLISSLRKHFPEVVFAEHSCFVKKTYLRAVEREASRYEKDILRAPLEKKYMLISAALTVMQDKLHFSKFPLAELYIKDALEILGYTPIQAAQRMGANLTHADAKEWFALRPKFNYEDRSPTQWLLRNFNKKLPFVIYPGNFWEEKLCWDLLRHSDSEAEVIYWVQNILNDAERRASLLKKRTLIGPHGEQLTYSLVNRLDEIKACDLENGIKSGVMRTFERAAERQAKEKIKNLKRHRHPLISDPEWWPGDSEEWKLLRSGADLIQEGDEMDHCVAQYIPYVKNGESIIISIRSNVSRSTVELDGDGSKVLQHLGWKNTEPHAENVQLLSKLLREILKNKKRNELQLAS